MANHVKESCSVIIINWNGKSHLEDCIPSLLKAAWPFPYEIIVVDNGSTDGSVEYMRLLAKKHTNIHCIQNSRNLGFAETNNQGFARSKGSYILFLNNDTVVTPSFFGPLLSRLESDGNIAAVQPKICKYPDTSSIDSVGSFFLSSGFLYHVGHNKPYQKKYDRSGPIFTMKGACMLFRRDVLEKTGVFDPAYFAYFEETDLCHRVWLTGKSIWYESGSTIYHKGGVTSTRFPSSYIQFHSYKNRMYTYLKNFEIRTLCTVVPLHTAMCAVIIGVYILTGKPMLGWAILKAFLWNISQLGRLRIDRRRIATLRKKTDTEYLPFVSRSVGIGYYYHLFATSLAGFDDSE